MLTNIMVPCGSKKAFVYCIYLVELMHGFIVLPRETYFMAWYANPFVLQVRFRRTNLPSK